MAERAEEDEDLKAVAVLPSHKRVTYSFNIEEEIQQLVDFLEDNNLVEGIRELVLNAEKLLPEDRDQYNWFKTLFTKVVHVEEIRISHIDASPLLNPEMRSIGLEQLDFVHTLRMDECPHMEEVLAKLLADSGYLSMLEKLTIGFISWTPTLTASLMCVTSRRDNLTTLSLSVPIPKTVLQGTILRSLFSQLTNLQHLAVAIYECNSAILDDIKEFQIHLHSLALTNVKKAQALFIDTLFSDTMYHYLVTLSFEGSVGLNLTHFRGIDFVLATPSLCYLNLEGTRISLTQEDVIELLD